MSEEVEISKPQIQKVEIPPKRIKGAEGFGTWGHSGWKDTYTSDPTKWAENQIRMLNKDLEEIPDGQKKIEERDVLYQWFGAYLGEYNSQGRERIDTELNEKFETIYGKAIEEAYKEPLGDEKARKKAKATLDGLRKRRARLGKH